MSYRDYVIGAYALFALVLLWDFLVPKWQIHITLRTVRRRLSRRQTAPRNPELPLSRD